MKEINWESLEIIGMIALAFAASIGLGVLGLKRGAKRRLRKALSRETGSRQAVGEALEYAVQDTWGLMVPLGMAFGVTGIILSPGDDAKVGILLGSLGIVLISGILLTLGTSGVYLGTIRKEMKRAMEAGTEKDVMSLAGALVDLDKLYLKVVVVREMVAWGSPEAIPFLWDLHSKSPPGHVSQPPGLKILSKDAAGKLTAAAKLAGGPHAPPLFDLAREYIYYGRLLKAVSQPGGEEEIERLAVHTESIREVYLAQRDFLQSLDTLYCTECSSRAKMIEKEGGRLVCCKRCERSRSLITGVTHVRGLLGPASEGAASESLVELSLWDASDKKVRYAEVDSLQLGDLPPEEMEWALAALVEVLTNEYPPERLPIPLENPLPEGLSQNARRAIGRVIGGETRIAHPESQALEE